MGESRSLNFTPENMVIFGFKITNCKRCLPVRFWTSVGNQIHSKFPFRSFDSRVSCTGRYLIALSEQFKVMNQGLHGGFHFLPAWRSDFSIVRFDFAWNSHTQTFVVVFFRLENTWWHVVETLFDDAQRLTHLLQSAQVPVVAVAFSTDRYVEFDQIVRVVRLSFTKIPFDARTSQHYPTEIVIE